MQIGEEDTRQPKSSHVHQGRRHTVDLPQVAKLITFFLNHQLSCISASLVHFNKCLKNGRDAQEILNFAN